MHQVEYVQILAITLSCSTNMYVVFTMCQALCWVIYKDILGISELKWTGMGEFNSDDHYIYYTGRNPLEEME